MYFPHRIIVKTQYQLFTYGVTRRKPQLIYPLPRANKYTYTHRAFTLALCARLISTYIRAASYLWIANRARFCGDSAFCDAAAAAAGLIITSNLFGALAEHVPLYMARPPAPAPRTATMWEPRAIYTSSRFMHILVYTELPNVCRSCFV